MNKIYKISIIIISLFFLLSVECFAKYNYTFRLNAYSFTRDNSEITYTISKGDENTYTNKDVVMTINLNKPIYENIDGFSISEDKKTLTKTFTENETNSITVEDISGNKKEIEYSVNNIDKIPPEIIGVENGKTYSSNVTLDYKDNVGIKEIKVDKYSDLELTVYDDYYDNSFFKGIDVLDTTAKIRVSSHPKNTYKYRYYINNSLKAQTTEKEYQFTGLSKATSYTVKVEAIDKNGKVLQTVTRGIKTKLFSKIEATKNNSGTFTVTVYGIDSSIDRVALVSFWNGTNHVYAGANINSNRSVTTTFTAQAVTGSVQSGYYYFHVQLYDNERGGLIDTACCNIIFNQSYNGGGSTQNLYNLTSNGNYQIIVTDLAGNQTEKCVTIKK